MYQEWFIYGSLVFQTFRCNNFAPVHLLSGIVTEVVGKYHCLWWTTPFNQLNNQLIIDNQFRINDTWIIDTSECNESLLKQCGLVISWDTIVLCVSIVIETDRLIQGIDRGQFSSCDKHPHTSCFWTPSKLRYTRWANTYLIGHFSLSLTNQIWSYRRIWMVFGCHSLPIHLN